MTTKQQKYEVCAQCCNDCIWEQIRVEQFDDILEKYEMDEHGNPKRCFNSTPGISMCDDFRRRNNLNVCPYNFLMKIADKKKHELEEK